MKIFCYQRDYSLDGVSQLRVYDAQLTGKCGESLRAGVSLLLSGPEAVQLLPKEPSAPSGQMQNKGTIVGLLSRARLFFLETF